MKDKYTWRFTDNDYGEETGLDGTDIEPFMKDPISSLARETCQNSIDASVNDEPVKVQFSLFEVPRENIPGMDRLAEEIEKCWEYKKDSEKEGKQLKALKRAAAKKNLTCLRVSDFNTKGVCGVSTAAKDTDFYRLTKGSGVSDKPGSSGGSKGIGKFASFVVSGLNTAFYSTRTVQGEQGCIGITRLRSVPHKDDPELMTTGIGYYSRDDKKHPILEELHLDPNFSRAENEFGTDIFITAFSAHKGWEMDVIRKVLESFMVAIVRGKLVVDVNGRIINAETVGDVIYSEEFDNNRKIVKDVRAQYELLQGGDDVVTGEIEVAGCKVPIMMREYGQQDSDKATKWCVIVRYPYMKITYTTTGAVLPFSALCILGDDDLGHSLRMIENAQHTAWEPNRLSAYPEDKKRVVKLKKELMNALKEFINEQLMRSSTDSTDMVGAGEFLPSQEEAGSNTDGKAASPELIITSKVKRVKQQKPKTQKAGEAGEAYDFGQGQVSDEGEEGRPLHEGGASPNPNPNPKREPDQQNETHVGDGDEPMLIKVPLSGLRYRTIVSNKSEGEYHCLFTAKTTDDSCDFEVKLCGEGADKYPLEILEASVNGEPCSLADGKIVDLPLEEGRAYDIAYRVDRQGLFASEVVMNAYRK